MGAVRKTLLAVAAVATLNVATPLAAQACACGAFVGDQKVKVEQETAIVELGAGRETVHMRFAAASAATRAAWVMPVPNQAEVKLGDRDMFTRLDRLSKAKDNRNSGTKPGDTGAPGAAVEGEVTVLDQAKVGPYDVAQLAGNDAAAIAEWLKQHNFTLPQNLADGLKPYLAEGWSVAAVRLSALDGGRINGDLPPIKMSFATSKMVYPMRLSGLAANQQKLRLYVVADHKMDATSPGGDGFKLYFAGIDKENKKYVTRYDGTWQDPSKIVKDIEFKKASNDQEYRTVIGSDGSLSSTTDEAAMMNMQPPGVNDAPAGPGGQNNDGLPTVMWILLGTGTAVTLAGATILLLRRRKPAGTPGN